MAKYLLITFGILSLICIGSAIKTYNELAQLVDSFGVERLAINDRSAKHEIDPLSGLWSYTTPDQQEVYEMIVLLSDYYGVDSLTATRIANCESGFKYNAQNAHSSAGGVYQWIDSSWRSHAGIAEKYNAYENIKAFMLVYPNNPQYWECK